MNKVVINQCCGPFCLTEEAFKRYQELGGIESNSYCISRHDPFLVKMVEEFLSLGKDPGGELADLKVVTIMGNKYNIQYNWLDGSEFVKTPESTTWIVI